MQSKRSRVIVAAAGSGKTEHLVSEALSSQNARIAILTYTNRNLEVIKSAFCRLHGVVPARIDVQTWYRFLLRECARPYQRAVYTTRRITSICFTEGRSDRYARYADTRRYYLESDDTIYHDKISRFVLDCQCRSDGCVTRRLLEAYDAIFLDEIQDEAGYDLDLLEMLMRSGIAMVMVGDPRQDTYSTNPASKNSRYRGLGLLEKIAEWQDNGLCEKEEQTWSHRCNQTICDFADLLYPEMPRTQSRNQTITGHDGIFLVRDADLRAYVDRYQPAILRYDKNTGDHGYEVLNFGMSKGMTCDRVLILPHGRIREYLRDGRLSSVKGSRSKFYVAVTRARHSTAILYDGESSFALPRWQP